MADLLTNKSLQSTQFKVMENVAPHILIVEDNLAMCRVIQVILEKAGHNVTCAHDGQSGWHAALENRFDLIITDQQMPKMTGIELCQKLRTHDHYASTPVLMLTAKGLELDLSRLKQELGIAEIFAKPFSPAKIIKVVEEYLAPTI